MQTVEIGSQGVFMGSMLHQVRNSQLVILILNLTQGLDEYLSTHTKKKEYLRSQQLTNRQIIWKLAVILQAKRFSCAESPHFRVMAVATHRDALSESELPSRIKCLDTALRSILLPSCTGELICTKDRIPHVLSLTQPQKCDYEALDSIRDAIRYEVTKLGDVEEIPGAFLVFHQELLECSAHHPDKALRASGLLSYDTCLKIGHRVGIGSEGVKNALLYLHRQNSLVYFRDVLPNCIFTKPQFPFNCIVEVAKFRQGIRELPRFTPRLVTSLEECISTEDILDNHLSKCFIPNLYETQDAIKLLCHTLTLVPLRVSREDEYLMMSLSPLIPEEEITRHVAPTSETVAPLAVKFTNDCVPLGCFSHTVASLLSKYRLSLYRDDAKASPNCLTQNVVSFYDGISQLQIVLMDAATHFEVHLLQLEPCPSYNPTPKACSAIRQTIVSAVRDALKMTKLSRIELSPGFLCHCQNPPHFLSMISSLNAHHLQCSVTKLDVGEAQEKHTTWFETPVNGEPTLPKMYGYNIPERIGPNYLEFGVKLLADTYGTRIAAIKGDYEGRSNYYESIVVHILRKWLQGGGLGPVTWGTLTKTLRDCQLGALADEIEQGENLS